MISIQERGQALEDAYFRARDAELIEKIQARKDAEAAKAGQPAKPEGAPEVAGVSKPKE